MLSVFKERIQSLYSQLRPQKNIGYTAFAPLRIAPEYTTIDLENKQVTGVVKYDGTVYLTVTVDVRLNKTTVRGSLRNISHLTYPFKKRNYIDMIKSDAITFMGN
ncbi:hypothetical protein ACTSEZ_09605 [Metabacillus sp. JX24]|uniref:hypothetical protein n=1 Tax=Metabacillus sp. JX24 TaxID=3240759 RepID=UPI0035103C71